MCKEIVHATGGRGEYADAVIGAGIVLDEIFVLGRGVGPRLCQEREEALELGGGTVGTRVTDTDVPIFCVNEPAHFALQLAGDGDLFDHGGIPNGYYHTTIVTIITWHEEKSQAFLPRIYSRRAEVHGAHGGHGE